jgi:hypothetical protein
MRHLLQRTKLFVASSLSLMVSHQFVFIKLAFKKLAWQGSPKIKVNRFT